MKCTKSDIRNYTKCTKSEIHKLFLCFFTLSSTGRSINSHAWDYISDSLEINDRLVIVGRGLISGIGDVRVMRGADVRSDRL